MTLPRRTCRTSVEGNDNVVQGSAGSMCHWYDTGGLRTGGQEASSKEYMHPQTMNSTTLMPKCSSTIVLRPMLALDSQLSIWGYEALIIISTCSCGIGCRS